VAITDHGTLTGAFEARAIDPELIVVGEEIHCRERLDLIGLFVTTHTPNGLTAREVAQRIRDQGGVVYAPHPFAYLERPRWKAELVLSLADVVEVFNARAFLPSWNRDAARAARERGLPGAASSDAHFPFEIGRARTLMPPFTDAESFRMALAGARPGATRVSSPLVHGVSVALRAIRVTNRPSLQDADPTARMPE
jgi:predicted metal-dependent phosphoesterase TrpH